MILLSGCSGWRLWPLSNEARSKQFLQLLQNEQREHESMIQRVYRQLCEAGLSGRISVVTSAAQADAIRNQIGTDIEVILEPERRDTFPAAAVAATHLFYESRVNPEETVLVLPVDTYVDSEYFEQLVCLDDAIQKGAADILLMGTSPTYPSAKYGYIIPGENLFVAGNGASCRTVASYVEKPSEKEAEQLLQKGALWNTGVFAFRLGFLMEYLKKYTSATSMEEFFEDFAKLPAKSFDYEMLDSHANPEPHARLAVVPYIGKWKDLGTWNTLTEEMSENNIGFARQGEECENTHVINELSIPVLVLGAKDMVVAASPDGILVSDKHKSSYIKPYVQEIGSRPMYEERRWGEYKVLDYNQYDDENKSLTKHLTIRAGKSISYQKHNHRDEIWTIVDGVGELLIDGHVRNVRRGDVAYIVKGQLHAMRAVTDLQFIEVQIGPELSEDDIERFTWEW